jgi:soluble lytic murein transglycosylase-like protein
VSRRSRVLPLAAAVVASALVAAPPAAAHLVVLVDGSVIKVADFRADGNAAELVFASGGRLRMPLLRVERVVDDEVVPVAAGEAAAMAAGAAAFPIRFDPEQGRPSTAYADLIFDAARRHEINPSLVAAVIHAESAFDARAVSHKGARGLMQLMPATGRRYGLRPSELFDPAKNIEAGVRYLRFLADRFGGDLAKVLAGYNAGEGSVDRHGGVPPYRETRGYIRRIYAELGLGSVATR